jgi:hypothetical protein
MLSPVLTIRARRTIDTNLLSVVENPDRGRTGPGVGWVGQPRSISAQFDPGFLPGCFSRDSLFVCTCMWAFDVVSFTVKA